MGAWTQSILGGLGNAGESYGKAVDYNAQLALETINKQLLNQEIQSRIKEQDFRLKQQQTPQFKTFTTPGQGTAGISFDPMTGRPMGQAETIIPGQPAPPKTLQQIQAEAIQKGDWKTAKDVGDQIVAQYRAEHPTTPKEPKFELKQAPGGEWYSVPVVPGTGKTESTGFKGVLPKSERAGGSGGMAGDEIDAYVSAVAGGQPITSVPMKMRGTVLSRMKAQGMELPVALTPSAQKTLEESTPVHEQIRGLLNQFEPLKGDNTPLKYFMQRLEYAAGRHTPIAGAADTIAQLELNRVVGAARVMKGSSRAVGMLQKAMVHLPDVWIDSPEMIYSKLRNLDEALSQIENSAIVYGKKGGIAAEQSTDDLINSLPLPKAH